jgi:serine phosphatase RsbU (regulator of sigma subunit)
MVESGGGGFVGEVCRVLGLASERLAVGVAVVAAGTEEVVYANPYARRVWARFAGGDDPWSYRGYRADGSAYRPEEWPLRRALRLGEVVSAEEISVEFSGGVRGVVALSASPLADRGGAIVGAVLAMFDLTEHRRAEETLRFMAQASRLLSETGLEYERTLEELTRLVVPRLADWCAIDLKTETGIENVGVAHVDPAKVELARMLQARFPPDPHAPTGVPAVIRTGVSQLTEEITDDLIDAVVDDLEMRDLLRELGLRSAIVAPLAAHGDTLGALTLISAEQGRRYTALDVAVAEDLGHRAALSIRNARLYQREYETNRVLQESLIPSQLPEVDGVEFGVFHESAGTGEVGGDFYDAWRTGKETFAVAIGDVQGKGAQAAALTALTRHTLRGASMHDPTPSHVLRMVNHAILSSGLNRFCTVVYIHLLPGDDGLEMTVGLGGHTPPILLRSGGRLERVGAPGTLLGLYPDIRIKERSYYVRPGDITVLWTDGVTDTPGKATRFGEQRLEQTIRRSHSDGDPRRMTETIVSAIRGFGEYGFTDDVAVLSLAVTAQAQASQRGAA